MNFGLFTPEEAVGHQPRVIVLDEKNEVVRYEGGKSVTDNGSLIA